MDSFSPRYAPISGWCKISGMGRTKTYEAAGKGNIRIIKVGKRSLVDVSHRLAWLDSLPVATLSSAASESDTKPFRSEAG